MPSDASVLRGPLARDVAVRALVLRSVVKIAMAVSKRDSMSEEDFSAIRDHYLRLVLPYVPAFGIEDGVFLIEEDPARLEAAWPAAICRIEHFQVMAWALGRLDALPPYDTIADITLLDLPALKEPAQLPFAVLRPAGEIDHAGKVGELWYWRIQVHKLVRDGAPLPPSDETDKLGLRTYADYARWLAETSSAMGILPAPIGGDFPAFGKPYRDLADEELGRIYNITYQRHYSFTWLRRLALMNDWDHAKQNL
ncbi:MAG: hypothetical protein JNM30_07905 [Rhodospirillales bacterium]|nr:hypothetical protein [Rhodospirillales bacterium]